MKKDKFIMLSLITIILLIVIALVFMIYKLTNSNEEKTQDFESNSTTLYNENNEQNNIIANNSNTVKENNNTNQPVVDNSNNSSEVSNDMNDNKEIQINLIINNQKFKATLYNNDTVKELISHFPMTLNMSELHSNEKYDYLDFNLRTNTYTPNRINAGDIKLFGNNCLVVFYKGFSNSFSYTDLGKIENVNDFVSELGSGNITIRFEMN